MCSGFTRNANDAQERRRRKRKHGERFACVAGINADACVKSVLCGEVKALAYASLGLHNS